MLKIEVFTLLSKCTRSVSCMGALHAGLNAD